MVGNVGDEISGEYDDTNIANARLIAAAPELLAALERVTELLRHDSKEDLSCPRGRAVAQALGALAKATGAEQP